MPAACRRHAEAAPAAALQKMRFALVAAEASLSAGLWWAWASEFGGGGGAAAVEASIWALDLSAEVREIPRVWMYV